MHERHCRTLSLDRGRLDVDAFGGTDADEERKDSQDL